ncbi:hypothetical protein [Novipirellula artificiosorum]|uniref:hypothetical protein n=1 Tax=Novipirellula artificiosorum TaxID=2528016 RepID=UPI0011B57035|nr:hypothetical protein [Novipirellula artificiosorum]
MVTAQRRAKTRNLLIRSLACGVMKLDDPVMQLVRIRFAELVEAEQESSQSRGPPEEKRADG